MALLPDGRVPYSFKKRWQDGSRAVVLSPQVLIERLVALVPRPQRHLITYHGVLAPAAGLRSRIVPQVEEEEGGEAGGCRHAGDGDEVSAADAVEDDATCRVLPRRVVLHAPGKRRRGRRRYSWAQLLQRVS